MTMKVPRKRVKGDRARPLTSRPHKLKDVHHSLWKFYWKRSRILPDETYNEFQIVAARHFHTSQGAISRRLAVLIEHEAVVVVRPRERGTSKFWTSQVIQPTEPLDDDAFEAFSFSPLSLLKVDQVIENKAIPSTFTSASVEAHCNPLPLDTSDLSIQTRTISTGLLHYDAEVKVDQVVENKPSSLLSKVKVDEGVIDLGDRIVAAHQKLTEYENAAASSLKEMGDDCGWGRCAANQREVIARLRQEYAELKGGSR